ncbi:MAG: glucosamine-6-phosphate deaminase [Pirellulaceae bacterium]
MRVVLLETPQQVSERAADLFCEQMRNKPTTVLGLATGSTPLGTYQELVRRHRSGEVSFSQATTFNLDEYLGLSAEHPQSYHTFMKEHLFSQADFDSSRCFIPDGQCDDWRVECARYERLIQQQGGIDIQLLGIGTDGHIAFNEPGSSLASRTRIKALTKQTRADNSRFFDSPDDVPRVAITMGIGTILEAEHIVLLATGASKASAVRAFIEGPVTAQVPASALQLHPRVTVLLDRQAADWLVRKDYYAHVESIQVEMN